MPIRILLATIVLVGNIYVKRWQLLALGLSFSALAAVPALADPSILSIYGDDDRQELYEVQSRTVQNAARSVVLLADSENVETINHGRTYNLNGETYGKSINLCRSERFWEQKRIGYCTGVLVRPNVVLTAGHCIVTEKDCRTTRILFDIAYRRAGALPLEIPAHQVRECKRIIRRENRRDGLDYGLIELSEPIYDRLPLAMDPTEPLPQTVFMIGHPMGLPAKFSGVGRILRSTANEWIYDLDSSAGNSGSPVFEATSGALVGILTAGQDGDFQDQKGTCKISRSCTAKSCFGEVVLKLQAIRQSSGW